MPIFEVFFSKYNKEWGNVVVGNIRFVINGLRLHCKYLFYLKHQSLKLIHNMYETCRV